MCCKRTTNLLLLFVSTELWPEPETNWNINKQSHILMLRKQPTFDDNTTGFLAKWRPFKSIEIFVCRFGAKMWESIPQSIRVLPKHECKGSVYMSSFYISVDCSQAPIFSWDRRDKACLTVNGGHLDFQMYQGAGVGNYSSSGRVAWKIENIFLASSPTAPAPKVVLTLMQDGSPYAQSARSRRS